VTSRCHGTSRIDCVECVEVCSGNYLLEIPGNLLEFCFHDFLDTLVQWACLKKGRE